MVVELFISGKSLSLLKGREDSLWCGVEGGWMTVSAGQTVGVYSLARIRYEEMSNLGVGC